MPSPFPGMDPYLERPGKWPGVHTELHVEIKRALLPQLGGKYSADTELTLFLHEPPAHRRVVAEADVGVAITGSGTPSPGGAAVAEPSTRMRLVPAIVEEKHRHLEIRTAEDDRVVTVIEVLSPTNKRRPEERARYLGKRDQFVRAGVHVLQIDLLRGGPRLLPEEARAHDYNALLRRADTEQAEVWLWTLRDRLPTLPVPLLEPDPDAVLDLQAVLDRVYDAGGYAPHAYRHDPDPPLDAEDAAWARGLLAGG